MAPLPGSATSPLKRSPGSSQPVNGQPSKKLRRSYHHHHALRYAVKSDIPGTEPAFVDDAQIDLLLKRAIITQCQGYGFESIEPVALERYRDIAEEYIMNFTSFVAEHMIGCRRTQPTPKDFEWAFERTKVPEAYREGELPFEELEHDLKIPFGPNSPALLPTPPPEDLTPPSLDNMVMQRNRPQDGKKSLVPVSFPALPSVHSFRQTPFYTPRENDPRRIRELATEEGRIGEEALRKLAGATRLETKVDLKDRRRKADILDWGGKKPLSMDAMFEKTMQSVMRSEMEEHPEMRNGGGEVKLELGPIVNWERKYWMQPSASGKGREDTEAKKDHGVGQSRGMSNVEAMDLE